MVFVIISILWETFSRLHEKSMAFVHANGCKVGSQPKGYSFIISAKLTQLSSILAIIFVLILIRLLYRCRFSLPFATWNMNAGGTSILFLHVQGKNGECIVFVVVGLAIYIRNFVWVVLFLDTTWTIQQVP